MMSINDILTGQPLWSGKDKRVKKEPKAIRKSIRIPELNGMIIQLKQGDSLKEWATQYIRTHPYNKEKLSRYL